MSSPSSPPNPNPNPPPGGQAGGQSAAGNEPAQISLPDMSKFSEEVQEAVKQAHRSMQADYTRKTQALAKERTDVQQLSQLYQQGIAQSRSMNPMPPPAGTNFQQPPQQPYGLPNQPPPQQQWNGWTPQPQPVQQQWQPPAAPMYQTPQPQLPQGVDLNTPLEDSGLTLGQVLGYLSPQIQQQVQSVASQRIDPWIRDQTLAAVQQEYADIESNPDRYPGFSEYRQEVENLALQNPALSLDDAYGIVARRHSTEIGALSERAEAELKQRAVTEGVGGMAGADTEPKSAPDAATAAEQVKAEMLARGEPLPFAG